MSSSSRESFVFSNISATTAAFQLRGGRYAITATATFGGGSITLQRLAANGTTYITCATQITQDAFLITDLPVGTYKLTIATATAVYIDLQSIAVPV